MYPRQTLDVPSKHFMQVKCMPATVCACPQQQMCSPWSDLFDWWDGTANPNRNLFNLFHTSIKIFTSATILELSQGSLETLLIVFKA